MHLLLLMTQTFFHDTQLSGDMRQKRLAQGKDKHKEKSSNHHHQRDGIIAN